MIICRLFLLTFLLATTLAIQQAHALTLRWEWVPNADYTSGPGGDVAYSLYMMEEGGSGYELDFPIVTDLDDCWWNIDKYECQGDLFSSFTPGATYYITCVAYVVTDPLQRSAYSIEVMYTVPPLPDSDGDGLPDEDEIDVWDSLGVDPYGDLDGDGTNNLNDSDADGDGLSDADEIQFYGTSPGATDSDNDGIDDGIEILFWDDYWCGDLDADGLINVFDIDSDGDGLIDGSDNDPFIIKLKVVISPTVILSPVFISANL